MFYSQAQSLDNSPAGAIKAIFTFEDFTNEIQLPNLSLQVTLGEATKTIPLPFKDALLLESSDLNAKSKVQFQLEETDGDIVGYTEMKIPGSAFVINETEINQKVQFQVVKGPKSSFTTNVRVIFLNKKGAKLEDSQVEEAPRISASSSKKTLLAETLRPSTAKQPRSQDTSPMKKDSPSLKKELREQYSISQLISLNKGEKNIPNDSFLEEHSISQLHLELESPTKGKDLDLSDISSPTRNPKKLSRKNTMEAKEVKPTNKKVLKTSMTQVFKEKSPKASTKQPTLYDAVKKLTGDIRSPKKVEKRAIISFDNPIELNEETQVPEVLAYLEQTLADHDYMRACIEFVKNSILTMEFKVNEVDVTKSDNEKLKQQVRSVEESKVRLQAQNTISIENLKQENDQLREKIASLNREVDSVNNKYHASQNDIIQLKENIAKHSVTITQKDNDLMSAELKNAELIDTRNKLKRAEEALTRTEGQRINDQKNFTDSLERAKKAFEDAKVLYDKTAQEKREISMQLNEERLAHNETRNRIVLLERQLENAEAYKEVMKSLEVQRDELLRQLAELRADKEGVYKLIEKAQSDMGLKFREFEKRENEYIEKAKILDEKIKAYEFKYSNLAQEFEKSELHVSQLKTKLIEMEELQNSHDKIAEEVERLKEKLTQAVQHSVNLNSGIDNITENHDAMAQRTLELERANNDLIEVIAEKQNEIVYLKQSLAAAINEIPRYVPIKDDPVDSALANILNANKETEKYRLLFIRETEGVYQFGTKKIYIKIEGERVLIRVGGGYMTLEELLETIAPAEFDKLQKYSKMSQDQASNLVAKNIVLNQVISGKCVNTLQRANTQAYKYSSKGVTPKSDPNAMKTSFSSKVSRPL